MAYKQTITYSGNDVHVSDNGNLNVTSQDRVKQYSFSIGSLTSAAAHFDVYTNTALNGQLQAIEWMSGNNAATGSLFIYRSGGAATQIWGLISGTAGHMLGESFVVFPRASTVSTTDYSLSGTTSSWYSDIPLNSVLRVVGSSIGASKSGLGLNLVYI